MKKLFLSLFVVACLTARENVVLTLPKSGTFLLIEVINRSLNKGFVIGHVHCTNTPIIGSDRKYVLVIRDLRDWFVSFKNFRTKVATHVLKPGNKGQIGQWKEVFPEEHIRLFKAMWNSYLVEWGYEQNWDWDEKYLGSL